MDWLLVLRAWGLLLRKVASSRIAEIRPNHRESRCNRYLSLYDSITLPKLLVFPRAKELVLRQGAFRVLYIVEYIILQI